MIQRKAPNRGRFRRPDESRRRQKGQGLIEYAMALLMMVGSYQVVDTALRKNIGKIWLAMAKDIAPGCPGCEKPDELK